jgi:hypothetical protein
MKEKMFLVPLLSVVAVCGLAFSSCDPDGNLKNDQTKFEGRWVDDDDPGYALDFSGGNSLTVIAPSETGAGTFSFTENLLTIILDEGTMTANYILAGNTLTLSNATGGSNWNGTFTKGSALMSLNNTTWTYTESGTDLTVTFTATTWQMTGSIAVTSDPVNLTGTYNIPSAGNINIKLNGEDTVHQTTYTATILNMFLSPPETAPFVKAQ